MPSFEERIRGDRKIREMDAEREKRILKLPRELLVNDCVLVQPDPNLGPVSKEADDEA